MRPEDILASTPAGLCCKLGSFHIDPTRPVERALITHAHSDHARAGHGAVLATQETLDLMRLRYGEEFAGTTQAICYGESVNLGGVTVTFHPAGHVLGSAQIAVEANGLRVVASGVREVRAARPQLGVLLITHYQRILEYLEPDRVHLLVNGRVVDSGGPDLARRLEKEGYEAWR